MSLIDTDRLNDRMHAIALFARVGLPIPDAGNARIDRWEDWEGPESPSALEIALRQQSLHDSLVTADAEEEWLAALRLVVAHAAPRVPYDEQEDAWHAPTTAVWSAAWAFALEELHLSRRRMLPPDIAAQIAWYERGHWPCALVEGSNGVDAKDYVIF